MTTYRDFNFTCMEGLDWVIGCTDPLDEGESPHYSISIVENGISTEFEFADYLTLFIQGDCVVSTFTAEIPIKIIFHINDFPKLDALQNLMRAHRGYAA